MIMAGLLFLVHGPDGSPVPKEALQTLYCADLSRTSLRVRPTLFEDGRIGFDRPEQPIVVVVSLAVPGFGRVYQVADNGGQGYREPGEYELVVEFAASRATAVTAFVEQAKAQGCEFPAGLEQRLGTATSACEEAREEAEGTARIGKAYEALREGLWAGEMAVFEHARHEIAQRGPREGFLFGCNAFGYRPGRDDYAGQFAELLNFATLPFYWRSFEPEPGKKGFDRVDVILKWCEQEGIQTKGHPLTWFHNAGIPEWIKGKSFQEIRELSAERTREIVSRYRGRIEVWDVINEAHDWGNELGFSQEELLDMTRMACECTREANPEATIIINNCCPFGEYVSQGHTYFGRVERPMRDPITYMRACLDAGLDFDVTGVQLYYPGYDMFEIARLLDRYIALGKPVHVTELGVSSSPERDEHGYVKDPAGSYWHEPWSEGVQADWVEQFYTLCYSKPEVEAITWWDFSDQGGHFWPHGGFVRPDGSPKESYDRLRGLIGSWGG